MVALKNIKVRIEALKSVVDEQQGALASHKLKSHT